MYSLKMCFFLKIVPSHDRREIKKERKVYMEFNINEHVYQLHYLITIHKISVYIKLIV